MNNFKLTCKGLNAIKTKFYSIFLKLHAFLVNYKKERFILIKFTLSIWNIYKKESRQRMNP